MSVAATSGFWSVEYFDSETANTIDDIDFSGPPRATDQSSGEIDQILLDGNEQTVGGGYAVELNATITLDNPEDIAFYLSVAGDANVYIDGELALEVRCEDLPGVGPGPCPETGGTVCACAAERKYDTDNSVLSVDAGTHEVTIQYLNHLPDEAMTLDWAVGNLGRQPFDLSIPEAPNTTDADGGGEWGGVEDWPLIGIHAILTADHKLLTFGTDERGKQGGEVVYDVWDYQTKTHETLANTTGTDIFCSVPVLIAETGEILIAGGDSRATGGEINLGVDDANIFNPEDNSLRANDTGDMEFARWYATAVTLSNGKVVLLGGIDADGNGVGTPEIFTPGVGFKSLEGAESGALANGWFYPRAWPASDGTIVVMTSLGGGGMHRIDPSGDGSVSYYGDLDFRSANTLPAVMYAEDKFLIMATDGKLWTVDVSGDAPVAEMEVDLGAPRHFSTMTLLPDGTVMVSGGGSDNTVGGLGTLYKEPMIWNPETGESVVQDGEALGRLYHSTAILLPDATILSLGGGAPGPFTNTNGEVYQPEYLFDENGDLADRLVILDSPEDVKAAEDFMITVDDPGSVARITMVKHGSVTHTLNMETRFLEVDYTVGPDGAITIDAPENTNVYTPGAWMVFAWDDAGVPSHAITVNVGLGGEIYIPGLGKFATLSGSAEMDATDGTIDLTQQGDRSDVGIVSTNEKIDFTQSFSLSMEINLGSVDGADGMAVFFHNDPLRGDVIGGPGGNLGVSGIENVFGIEFDTYNNETVQDNVAGDHSNFLTTVGGNISPLSQAVSLGELEDGAWRDLEITWDAASQTLSYQLNGVAVGSYTGDLAAEFFAGSSGAYLAVAGATGGLGNAQSVRFTDLAHEDPPVVEPPVIDPPEEPDGDPVPADYDAELIGTAGNDRLDGTSADEWIDAGAGSDRIDAGAGDDFIIAGAGNDWNVYGGSGADIFAVSTDDENVMIRDWEDGVDTVFLLDGLSLDDISFDRNDNFNRVRVTFEQSDLRLTFRDIADVNSIGLQDFREANSGPRPNEAPDTADDSASTSVDTPVTIAVLDNDSDDTGHIVLGALQLEDADGASGLIRTVAGEGQWSVNPAEGTITFSPEDDFVGQATDVSYTVADDAGARSEPATVSVEVTSTSGGPSINPDDYAQQVIGTNAGERLNGTAGDDYIDARGGSDRVDAGAGDDVIFAGSGNDWNIFGGSGADTFAVSGDDEIYMIRDFENGVDKILLTDGLSLEDVSYSPSANNNRIEINFEGSDLRLVLHNVDPVDIGSDDFIFV